MALINSAHDPGFACLAFSRDGSTLYTGGSDCLVRIWQADGGTDQEPSSAIDADQPITCLSSTEDGWLSGSVDSQVRSYAKAKYDLTGVITTTPGVAIHSIAVDPPAKRVAVASNESAVKLIDLENTQRISLLEGHSRGVRKVTWHPSGSLLTTCGSDGKVIVWDVSDQVPKIEKTIDGVIPAIADDKSPEFQHDCSVIWHPSGQYFYASTRSHEIVTISRTTWAKSSTFTDDALTGAITALSLSPNGLYLASASKSGIFIWSTQTRGLLFKHGENQTAPVTQMLFSPTKNSIAWMDGDGTLTRWPSPIPASSPHPVKPAINSAPAKVKRKPSPGLFDDFDADNELGDNVNGDIDMDEVANEDWILDALGDGLHDEPEAERWDDKDGIVKEMVSVTKAQPAFQSGSSPMENKRRYLAYNTVGVIELTDQDTHQIINVEFHDRSTRTSTHFTDYFKYDMASLGERGALYACPPDNVHPAHVVYKPYGTWATQGEWTYELPVGVRALGIAAGGSPPRKSLRSKADLDIEGNGNVVIATTENDLTFLNGGGVERFIMGLDGDFVSMVAGTEWVFVVYRDGSTTMDGSQNLRAVLIEFHNFTVLQDKRLCIKKGHQLKWVGITDDGAPAIFDSSGVLHVLHHFRAPLRATWARVLDTTKLDRRQGKDESYWPVGVSRDMFMCLILKGRQEHPGWPRPLIQEIPLRLPFRGTDPKEAPLEEHIARETLRLDILRDALGDESTSDEISQRELDIDKKTIQLIQNACKNDKLPRVLDLTKMLHHTPSFDMALKVAGFYHLIGLQEKIGILKEDREDGDDDFREAARQQRKQWKRDSAAVPPPRRAGEISSHAYQTVRPLQDFGPPPAIHRPGLARAMGISDLPKTSTTSYVPPSEWNDSGFGEGDGGSADLVLDGKRKRDDEEQPVRDPTSAELEGGSKRRALAPFVPSKPKPNPFAKKPEGENNRNPFARNNDKSLHKSETFFDKVEAAETGSYVSKRPTTKSKNSEKKAVPRQTTLFGMPAVQPPSDKDKGRKKKTAKDSQATVSECLPETQEDTEIETQSTDVTMLEAATSQTLIETCAAEEETQLVEPVDIQNNEEGAAAAFDEKNGDDEIGEIEWPPSPPQAQRQTLPTDEHASAAMIEVEA